MDKITENEFKKELAELINRYSLENGSNTPDYILAEYLVRCIDNFDQTIKRTINHIEG